MKNTATNPTLPELEQRVEEARDELERTLYGWKDEGLPGAVVKVEINTLITAVEALATARETERCIHSHYLCCCAPALDGEGPHKPGCHWPRLAQLREGGA